MHEKFKIVLVSDRSGVEVLGSEHFDPAFDSPHVRPREHVLVRRGDDGEIEVFADCGNSESIYAGESVAHLYVKLLVRTIGPKDG